MKFLKKSILFSIALCCSSLLTAQIYVEISDCTKELAYTYSATNGTNYEYYDYHFALNDYETVIFEISKNAFKPISENDLSSATVLKCGADNLASQLSVEVIEGIQKNKQKVMLVKQTNNGYVVGQAMEAIYSVYLPTDKYLRIVAREYGFDYDGSGDYEKGAELKTNGQGSFVLFSAQQERCYDKPSFMHVPLNFMETSTIDYILGIGRVRQYSDEMEHQLVAINGQPFENYLSAMCNGSTSFENPIVTTEENLEIPSETVVEEIALEVIEDVFVEEVTVEGIESDVETAIVETEIPTEATIVEEKEAATLTVPTLENLVPNVEEETVEVFVREETVKILTVPNIDDLRDENGEIDMSLIDEGSAALIENSTAVEKGGGIFKSNPMTKEDVAILESKTNKNANLHTVIKGETLYSISKKYNLTTLEIKELNDLNDNTIEVGQKLKIKK